MGVLSKHFIFGKELLQFEAGQGIGAIVTGKALISRRWSLKSKEVVYSALIYLTRF